MTVSAATYLPVRKVSLGKHSDWNPSSVVFRQNRSGPCTGGKAVKAVAWLIALAILTGLAGCKSANKTIEPDDKPTREDLYDAGDGNFLDQAQAEATPPIMRWAALRELSNTASIDVICYPKSTKIQDDEAVSAVVNQLMATSYVSAGFRSAAGPDLKIYFRRPDNTFIMAARVHLNEGILESPEGPLIKAHSSVMDILLADGTCRT